MDILERVSLYRQDVKRIPYIYSMQRLGIELFIDYIQINHLDIDERHVNRDFINKVLLYWIPKNKKYLTETQAYQVVYTLQDLYNYIIGEQKHRGNEESAKEEFTSSEKMRTKCMQQEDGLPTILDVYAKEYMRMYKVRNLLLQMTKDPVISVDPIIIDINKYRDKRKKNKYSDIGITYEQGVFKVEACKEGGQVILTKPSQMKQYKLLLEYPAYKELKTGDLIHATIRRKLFYVYWEIEEIKSYYLPQAITFL